MSQVEMPQEAIAKVSNTFSQSKEVLNIGESELDPREALDRTLKLFDIKASSLAESAGVSEQAVSRYRNRKQDMTSLTLYKLISALPLSARFYFSALLISEEEVQFANAQSVQEARLSFYRVAEQEAESGYPYRGGNSPPSAFSLFLLNWLFENQTSPLSVAQQSEMQIGQLLEILQGKAPSDKELQRLAVALPFTVNQLREIRDRRSPKAE